MGTFDRMRRTSLGRKLLGPPLEPLELGTGSEEDAPDDELEPEGGRKSGRTVRRAAGWVERRAEKVVKRVYEARAEDLEDRAKRVVGTLYEKSADDLEERAVRAMRRAIEAEAHRIRDAIEHGVEVKRREVRLSLLVLIVAALMYLALEWWQSSGGPAS
jgi:hypothetical protein